MTKSFQIRVTLLVITAACCLVPLYAHHGSDFLSKALEMNTAEVQLADLAVKKADSPSVKEFAEMVSKDHNQSIDKIKQLMAARNMPVTNVKLTAEQQKTLDRLSSLSGPAFDREFMNVMVRGHQEAIRTFETQSRAHGATGDTTQGTRQKPSTSDQTYSSADLNRDADTADFATESLPVMKHHLEQAEQIQKWMGTTK